MKKYLLGTTAFAAASLAASGASAQSLEERIRTLEEQMLMGAPGSGFDITVSGYIHGGFFLQDIDPVTSQDYADTDIKMGGAEAQFTAQTTLDNGVDIMGRIELSGFTTDDQIDETYIRAQGEFGQITLGADDDVWNLTHYSTPNPGLNGIDSPNYRHAAATGARTGTNDSITGDANKVTYFTPRLSGFQFGISYTPNTENTDGDSGSAPYDRNSGDIENVIGLGANFSRSFGGTAVGASAGWQSGSDNYTFDHDGDPGTADVGIDTNPVNWHVGGTVSRGGWTIGGAYARYGGIAVFGYNATNGRVDEDNPVNRYVDLSSEFEQTVWAVGATYGTDLWTVGVGYLQSEADGRASDVSVEADKIRDGDVYGLDATRLSSEAIVIGGGASYVLVPGVTVAADVAFYGDDNGRGQPNSNLEAVAAGFIIGINF